MIIWKEKHVKIRKAKLEDFSSVMELYKAAREFMKEHNNKNQWGEEYPQTSIIQDDILKEKLYVCMDDKCIVGVFYFAIETDSTYETIYEGNWQNEEVYGVVHRITSLVGTKGVASYCLNWCFSQINNIRIDTHKDNIPMQKLLDKNGFLYCGIIYLEDGSERIAYQKI